MKIKTVLPWLAAALVISLGVSGCETTPSGPSSPDESLSSLGRRTVKTRTTRKSTTTSSNGSTSNGGTQSTGGSGAPPSYDGCVQEIGFWQCNLISWPPPYNPDSTFCVGSGATFVQVLYMQSSSPLIRLAQNYIGALLNKTHNGGNIPPEVQAAINEAQLFFHLRDLRVPLTEAETEQALRLIPIFFDFNNGLGGIAPCP